MPHPFDSFVMWGCWVNIGKDQKLELRNGHLFVDGRQFTLTFPREMMIGVEENKLVTVYGAKMINYWDADEIEGSYI